MRTIVHVLTPSARPAAMFGVLAGDRAGAAGAAPTTDASAGLGDALAAAVRADGLGGAWIARLDGGELLGEAALPEWVAACRDAGAAEVELTTSGAALARTGLAAKVRALGVSSIAVPLFGADADAHDWVARQAGAQRRALAGIRNAASAGLGVTILAPLLRPTYRGLDQLAARSLALGMRTLEISYVAPPASVDAHIVAHPALAAVVATRAAALAVASRRGCRIVGLPACVLGESGRGIDSAALAGETRAHRRVFDWPRAGAFVNDPQQNEIDACAACHWRASCGGPTLGTTTTFGTSWVRARADAPPMALRERRAASPRTA